ncbi:MAG: hypothetical protein EGS53_04060 [Prevotella sp.]|uniref:hypothetical protein n=1 Tax=Segatella hominis TaxID=2518605 RepID=UPI001D9D38A3|nr:hypothetical protein [Prevotella sp.]
MGFLGRERATVKKIILKKDSLTDEKTFRRIFFQKKENIKEKEFQMKDYSEEGNHQMKRLSDENFSDYIIYNNVKEKRL